MIQKRYTYQRRRIPASLDVVDVQRVGWYLFDFVPIYVADVQASKGAKGMSYSTIGLGAHGAIMPPDAASARDDHFALWGPFETPEFLAALPSIVGAAEDLGHMPTYWMERAAALRGWYAAQNPGKPWVDILREIGYSKRAADYIERRLK